ncbi:MAG: galactokinase [Ignavibacteriaceae bacterium]|nr:galactokinase [Ignavibacteriaceae bacterium]
MISSLKELYSNNEKILNCQQSRLSKLSHNFESMFGSKPLKYFSSPGRTEISGNHTDHNHGKVIAASIDLDSVAAASPNNKNKIVLFSEGYPNTFIIDLNKTEPIADERGTTAALIRGIAAGFKNKGYSIGGFNACVTSQVVIGYGLSSSASFEVLVGTILNYLFNDGIIASEEIAMIGQFAENKYFGKPCGLMDQIACAVGGIVSIDFFDSQQPGIQKIDFDFRSQGYKILVVDTEASHADLTDDYAAIPFEMKEVAKHFGKEFCAQISLETLLAEISSLRKSVSDRAVLRAIHFLEENARVEKQIEALNNNNFGLFLDLVNESGNSSYKYLQNIYSPKNIEEQSVAIALALSEMFIKKYRTGACRIHGGGFAGTIQLFLPDYLIDEYRSFISKIFRNELIKVLTIRPFGTVCLTNN